MRNSLSKLLIQEVYSIYEGIIDKEISRIENKELRDKMTQMINKAKEVFSNKIPYVNWFYKQVKERWKHYHGQPAEEAIRSFIGFSEEYLDKFQHFYNYNVPQINNFPIVNYDISEVLLEFAKIERKMQEGSKGIIPLDKMGRAEEIHVCSDPNYVWFDLKTTDCREESDAMGHCGVDSSGDTLFSLREKKLNNGKLVGYKPHVTATFHEKDKRLSQVKGRENKKPVEKYHPFILELLEKGIVEDFGGGAYYQDEDFGWGDISNALKDSIISSGFMSNYLFIDLVRREDIEKIKEHIDEVDVTENDDEAVGIAIKNGNEEIVKLLVEHGAEDKSDFEHFKEEQGSNWFWDLLGGSVDLFNFIDTHSSIEDLDKQLSNPVWEESALEIARNYIPESWMERKFGDYWNWDSIAKGFAEEFNKRYGIESDDPFVWEEIMEYFENAQLEEDKSYMESGKHDPKYPLSVYKYYRRYEGYIHSMKEIDKLSEDIVINGVAELLDMEDGELKMEIEEWRSLGEDRVYEDIDIGY